MKNAGVVPDVPPFGCEPRRGGVLFTLVAVLLVDDDDEEDDGVVGDAANAPPVGVTPPVVARRCTSIFDSLLGAPMSTANGCG